jgi:hypothetical protein
MRFRAPLQVLGGIGDAEWRLMANCGMRHGMPGFLGGFAW